MTKSQSIVFYSWQSDLPNATNRGFIQQALENAAKAIRSDESLQIEPVIDRDTAGIAGSPDISKTIFHKIVQAQVFVCDISIINRETAKQTSTRPVPNPNVLIELGYALMALGENRIIMVLNDAYGEPEVLPFDLRMRRVIRYSMPLEAESRASERKELEKRLKGELLTILNEFAKPFLDAPITTLTLAEKTRVAVETDRPIQVTLVRQYMDEVAMAIATMTPTFATDGADSWDEQLLQAIHGSIEMVVNFSQVAEIVAQLNASEAARVLYKGFGNILNLHTRSPEFQGPYHDCDCDLAKFLGHELFVIFFALLLQEERWELISTLLDEDLYARTKGLSTLSSAPFHHISTHIRSLDSRNDRLQLHRLSLHFDLLSERHTRGDLATLVPLEQFAEADFFLYLQAEFQQTTPSQWISWIPWSVLGMRHPPRYLQEAVRMKYAQHLLRTFRVEDIPTLRLQLREHARKILDLWTNGFWHYALQNFDFNTIGSR